MATETGFTPSNNTVKIIFVDNSGQGFVDNIVIPAGTTILNFVKSKTNNADPSRFVIRVNRVRPEADYVIQDGDKVTISPQNVKGA